MADPASNLLSDALMGKPVEQSGEAPIVSDTSVGMDSLPPSTGSSEPSWESTPAPVSEMPSTEIPIPPPDLLQATPVPIEPGKPLEAVSPTGTPVAPPTVSSLPPVPAQKGIPLTAVAGLAVLAVVTVGVVAAVLLSGQSQELRQRAYVPPATPAAQPASPSEVFVAPSAENSFISMKGQYPNATSKPIVTDGVRGTLYVADNPESSSRIYFTEMSGLESSPTSTPYAWLTKADDTFVLVGAVSVTTANGQKAYAVIEQFEDLENITGFLVSYENLQEVVEPLAPSSQRVVHVQL